MIRDAVVSHNSPGRLRVKIAALKGDVGALTACKEQFAQCPDISAVEVNETTGSMLFLHETSMAVITEYARTKDIFVLQEQPRGQGGNPGNLHQNITETFKGIDNKIKSLTDGEMNMGGVAFVVLLGAGVTQILSGNAGALPWYGAFWYAFNVFLKSNEPKK
jgi:superoxide dismutase